VVEATAGRATLELRFPPGLFPIESLRMRTASLSGVLDACEVGDSEAVVDEVGPGHARYSLRWRA